MQCLSISLNCSIDWTGDESWPPIVKLRACWIWERLQAGGCRIVVQGALSKVGPPSVFFPSTFAHCSAHQTYVKLNFIRRGIRLSGDMRFFCCSTVSLI